MQDLFSPHPALTRCVIRAMPGEIIVSTQLPLCPEIRLYLVSSSKPESDSIQSNIASLMDAPPY